MFSFHTDKKRRRSYTERPSTSKEDEEHKEEKLGEDNIWLGPAKITEEKTRYVLLIPSSGIQKALTPIFITKSIYG